MENAQFKQYAQIHIDTTKQIFGVDLDFDEKSILLLDNLIQSAWPDEPPVQIDSVITLFGSFFGEAIIRTLGGQWVDSDQGWGIKIGDATLMVFTKIKKDYLMARRILFLIITKVHGRCYKIILKI
ncbi:hypothetical protein HY933_03215 [Candidatus Falkowbacteria bacterium]|nr:hypothetical protein [Candidatus Falkowbacteria bacterium]